MKNYRIRSADGITFIEFSEPPSSGEIVEAARDLKALGNCRLRLWDFRCGLRFNVSETVTLARLLREELNIPQSRVARVVSDDFSYGMSRLYSAYREDEHVSTAVFRSVEEALDWLKS